MARKTKSKQEKKYGGLTVKSWAAIGAVGVGGYLLWKNFRAGGALPASAVAQVPAQTDSMLPGTFVPAAAGAMQPYTSPYGITPGAGTNTGVVPPMTMPSQYVSPTQYPYPAQPVPVPAPVSSAVTQEQYLASVGNPKQGATVKGPLPPPGMFPAFDPKAKGAGPKQKKCAKDGGTWVGPAGKRFCVMSA